MREGVTGQLLNEAKQQGSNEVTHFVSRLNDAAFERDITTEELDGIDPYEEIVETKLLQHQRSARAF